jgi:hypothetical protein
MTTTQFGVQQGMVIMNVLPFSLLMKEFDPSADSNEAIRLASNIGHHGCVSLFWADPRVRERRVTHAFH